MEPPLSFLIWLLVAFFFRGDAFGGLAGVVRFPNRRTIGVMCCLCCKPAGRRDGMSLIIGLGLVIVDHLLSYMHSCTCEKLPRYWGSEPRTRHNLGLLSCPCVSALMTEALSGLLPRAAISPPLPPLCSLRCVGDNPLL